jgi:hypothetical protein
VAFLPEEDTQYLDFKKITCEEVIEGSQHAVIFTDFPLPSGKYDHEKVEILVLLPDGYNDVGPDMFYTYPKIKLMPQNVIANKTEAELSFRGVTWQRWSRHAPDSDWRAGRDGIRTILKRIKNALEVATP